MAALVGETHIKGSTETARMMLLTFATIGITCVCAFAQSLPNRSPMLTCRLRVSRGGLK